ncbi:hypothetical protein AB0I54_34725 [Streptomyces sp. NPDC050625]|uniref:hypothetical protein n=1 Tax=Streptomyces sp. NPDC050625 TaxID=3154629 RepID=UPI00342CCD1B
MVVPCWSGRALERCAPGGGVAGTGGVGTSTPTPEGSPLRIAERWTATTGIHAP